MPRKRPSRSFSEAVSAVVRNLRRGEVVSYSEVARRAGYPSAARAVGNVLARGVAVPWWRVIRADGSLAAHGREEQARRLRREGVTVGDFPQDLKKELRERPEVRIETEEDGRRFSVIIWTVATPDGVFVRSYHGPRGKWYRRVKRDRAAVLRVGRRRVPVRARPDLDPDHNTRIDEAYAKKYAHRWPEDTAAMVKPILVRRTTLRLTPG